MNPTRLLLLSLASVLLATGANAAHYVIKIENMKFEPAPHDLKLGDTIEWQNEDMFRHSATAKGQFDVDLNPGEKRTVTIGQTGIVTVTCRYHPNMIVKLTVGKK